ncbi:NAD(P)H-dependent oxidoreductase [Ulvibacter litoralis]|uniref:Putative NADPH-quinone reductase (Modulator of drug activity B) n=1 Tax=Ulvibacter litoralis TaxID=227084 RepID=A0A1G7IJF6_9FLAO|nr:NAD(P)H-dependent oxidoreductase [Ulvibacter litoralis]GHC61051.1 NAD(P)H oxidoreductase [Ulvibacter litoralis]SDF12890.1 Putative NADPH-quinone reductase (modulator of drug activity B) [Ulvibacter litoralis]
MKTLVILIHPDIENSITNKRWIEELEKYPNKFDIHQLYKVYPDEKINVLAEQKLMEKYNKVIFQFPLYWFSSPPLLKKWFDEVLIYGWAFGSKSGYKLEHKKIGLAISAGATEDNYSVKGHYKHTLKEILAPFELTFKYVKANYQPYFVNYGSDLDTPSEVIEESAHKYFFFITAF